MKYFSTRVEKFGISKWSCNAGLKKELSSRPGQVDFLSGQVIFHSHLPDGQEIK